MLAVCVLAPGLYLLQARYESAIARHRSQTEAFYRRMLADDRVIRQAPRLSRLERAARADLAGVAAYESLGGVTAAFISHLEDCAAENGVRISMLQPASPQAEQPGASPDALVAEPLTISAAGRFPALLHFIAGLSHQRTLLEITGTQFALRSRDGGAAGKPIVDASIQAVLFRLASPHTQGASVAAVR
jgi:hypothetical protein